MDQATNHLQNYEFRNSGYCNCCEKNVEFVATNSWFRDNYLCNNCGSLPRERALAFIVKQLMPNYTDLYIHESSPAQRGASILLKSKCKNYSSSQFFQNIKSGELHNGTLCQDIQQMSFDDDTFDLFITQDVFEHLYHPEKAVKEIARVLKPSGFHIFTVPIVKGHTPSQRRISFDDNDEIIHLKSSQYHGNPVSNKGSLVTYDWGYDLAFFIQKHTNMVTVVYNIDNIDLGIRAKYTDVFVSQKNWVESTEVV